MESMSWFRFELMNELKPELKQQQAYLAFKLVSLISGSIYFINQNIKLQFDAQLK